jgi:hypothetical protein
VTVINSTNINKNEQSPTIPNKPTEHKKARNMMLEIQVLVWDRHKNVAGLNRLLGFQPSPLDN